MAKQTIQEWRAEFQAMQAECAAGSTRDERDAEHIKKHGAIPQLRDFGSKRRRRSWRA